MATVTLAWDPNPPEEQVTGYTIYRNGEDAGEAIGQTEYTLESVEPGDVLEVAANGPYGVGPKSDPVTMPPAASKVSGLKIVNITVNVTVN